MGVKFFFFFFSPLVPSAKAFGLCRLTLFSFFFVFKRDEARFSPFPPRVCQSSLRGSRVAAEPHLTRWVYRELERCERNKTPIGRQKRKKQKKDGAHGRREGAFRFLFSYESVKRV